MMGSFGASELILRRVTTVCAQALSLGPVVAAANAAPPMRTVRRVRCSMAVSRCQSVNDQESCLVKQDSPVAPRATLNSHPVAAFMPGMNHEGVGQLYPALHGGVMSQM